tara:strand:- start:1170 stop:1343 length:174 start_codon:yes stop_codon:yes gene_type:complete
MISSWATFWGWILGTSLVLFAVISVVVTIGGFRDIRELLAQADSNDEDPDAAGKEEE